MDPRQNLLALLRQGDTFLFRSLRDGGGAVVMEAIAAGKPIFCMDLAGPGVHITEDCGIKIPSRSADETVELMTQALERFHQDRELRSKIGQTGRARAEQVYSWDYLGERLLKVYEEMLGAPSQEA